MSDQKLIWIDTDPGLDDFLAICYACSVTFLKIIGCSSVFGNSSITNTTQNLLNTLKLLELDEQIPVYQGASKPFNRNSMSEVEDTFHGLKGLKNVKLDKSEQLAITEDVYKQISLKILSQPQKVTYVSLGPLTNLAHLLKEFPNTIINIEKIIFLGGSIGLGNVTPAAEFNIYCDPESLYDMDIQMCTVDRFHDYNLDHSFINKLQTLEQTNFIEQVTASIQTVINQCISWGYDSVFPNYDLGVIQCLVNPESIKLKRLNVEVECQSQFSDGKTLIDIYQLYKRKENVNVVISMDNNALHQNTFLYLSERNQIILEKQNRII